MTKTLKRRWLGAIGKLERFYRAVVKEEKPDYFDCPLCIIVNDDSKMVLDENCWKCLWKKYQKIDCENYVKKLFKDAPIPLRKTYNIPWAKDSLKRLARWRARLEKEKNDL